MIPGSGPNTPVTAGDFDRVRIGEGGEDAAVTRTEARVEYADLPVKALGASVNHRFALPDARAVDRFAGGEVVGTVHNNPVGARKVEGIRPVEQHGMKIDDRLWIDLRQSAAGAFHFWQPHALHPMQNLAVQVVEADGVGVDDPDPSDTRGRQVEECRRTQPAGADHQDARRAEPGLPGFADFRQAQGTGKPQEILRGKDRC